MESVYNQAANTINRDAWSRIVDAAQDPRRRDTVQEFLAGAELSGEIPAALDAEVLSPRRAAGATGEQCAFILCNLGFAALAVAGSRGSAEFAMACGRLVEQLAPNPPDLTLRRHFLFAKASLVVAALTDQPHLLWSGVAGRCTAYLRALDDRLEVLPGEAIASHAAAAYSFSLQFLSRLQKLRAIGHYADAASQLIEIALDLADRLPPAHVSRMWNTLMPGSDAGVFLRHVGVVAECSMHLDRHATDHAAKGLAYSDEILAQAGLSPGPELEHLQQLRAELLLLSGRLAEAAAQAEALESSPDPACREQAIAIKARCHLQAGRHELAAGILAQAAPTKGQMLDRWHTSWMGDPGGGPWTTQTGAFSPPDDRQEIWRLQAVAAADAGDMPAFLEAADRSTGFLADSLFQDRQQWAGRMRTAIGSDRAAANRSRTPAAENPGRTPAIAEVEPPDALDEILTRLVDGTALLQVVNTAAGILTWVARKRHGKVSLAVAPDRPDVNTLYALHNAWSRACCGPLRHGTGAPEVRAEGAVLFSGLMDEVGRHWGDLLQGLVEDGITQLVLIGDDLVDIPLHATPIGAGDEHLIDRVPVTYVPSLHTLRACIGGTTVSGAEREGLALCSLVDPALDSAVAAADSIAATLGTKSCRPAPAAASFWTDVSAAQVLHIVADVVHNARKPFDSSCGEGWLDLDLAELIAGLDLPRCEIVSNLACESALPAMLRAPGLDLAAVFLAAGARSVLTSTWLVNENIAAELAQTFFRLWVSGHAPAEAFQGALRRLRAAQPALPDYCWAGLRVVGGP